MASLVIFVGTAINLLFLSSPLLSLCSLHQQTKMKTLTQSSFHTSPTKSTLLYRNSRTSSSNQTQIGFQRKLTNNNTLFSCLSSCQVVQKAIPLTASVALLLLANPAKAGIMSGFSGIESVPGPQLPQIDFLNKLNEENQKKYAENDERFKSSPIVKQLLEKSKLNKEKNKKEIQDKYCVRGAEWGVGDCSAEGMSPQDRENFIAMLKEKAGMKSTD